MYNELNKYGVIECVSEPEIGCYEIALENEQNFNLIRQDIFGLSLVTESKVNFKERAKLVLSKVKEAIQKFWSKLMGVFKKVNQKIWENTNNNKIFVARFTTANMNEVDDIKGLKVVYHGYPDIIGCLNDVSLRFSRISDEIYKIMPSMTLKSDSQDLPDWTTYKLTEIHEMQKILCPSLKEGDNFVESFKKRMFRKGSRFST